MDLGLRSFLGKSGTTWDPSNHDTNIPNERSQAEAPETGSKELLEAPEGSSRSFVSQRPFCF